MPKREKHDPQYFDYVDVIKKRLNEKCPVMEDGVQEGISSIVKGLNNMGYNFSRSMVEGTLNEKSSSLNTIVVVALCSYWGLDVSYILSQPGTAEKEAEDRNFFRMPAYTNFAYLTEEAYLGEYHCYLYSRDNGSRYLWKAELNIHMEDGLPIASLWIHECDDAGNETKVRQIEGVAYVSDLSGNVIIFLKKEDGGFAFVTFCYSPINMGKMEFRVATFLSYSLEHARLPRMQKMVILRHEVQPENICYIQGMLKMDQGISLIRAADLDALAESNDSVKEFKESYLKLLEANRYDFYAVSDDILSTLAKEYDEEDVKNLLLIRSKSVEPYYVETPVSGIMREIARKL